MTRIVLVRHGQTEWNQEACPGGLTRERSRRERFRGQVDVPLNEAGLAQAQAVARRLEGQPLAAVYSSPLRRAMETARPTAEAHSLEVQPESGLLDIDYGEWGGLTPTEAETRDPDLLARWRQDPGSVVFPGGEGLADVQARAMATLDRLVEQYQGQTVLVVGHVVVNRALLLGVLGAPLSHFWELGQDNGAVNVIEWRYSRLVVSLLNDTCHLR